MNGTETPLTPDEKAAEYRRTHSRDGYGLGSPQYPDNREGRRKLARTWRGHRSWDRYAADDARLVARAIRREQRKVLRVKGARS